jgi:membrane fusion protein (multidrug efflux system)
MTFRLDQLRLPALVLLSVSMVPAAAAQRSPNYAELQGLVVLDNPHVLVERFVLQPGQSTGRHIYTGDQLLVFVKVGIGRGDQISVLSGLKGGEEVVTSGAFKLRNGAAVLVNNKVRPSNNAKPKPENS